MQGQSFMPTTWIVFFAPPRLRQHPRIAFMIVGDGKELPSLPQQAESQHLDNVRFVPGNTETSNAEGASCG